MSLATGLRPWTDLVRPHSDITSADLDMGTYAANLAAAALEQRGRDVYLKPAEFFASTYFTGTMRTLLSEVFGALAGQRGDRVVQLRTPFGGGKTHSLLALWHLAKHREAAARAPELDAIPDPGSVRVAILSGEYADIERGREVDGRTIRTWWGEIAYQLGGWPAYERILVNGQEGTPPGGGILGELLGDEPALLLLDEVLIYIASGKALKRGETTVATQNLIFLQRLTEAVNQRKHAAMVYSLQASVGEAVGEDALLAQLEKIHSRIDVRKEPVSGDEVLRVVQRRLFDELPDEPVRRQVAHEYAQSLRVYLEASAETDADRAEAARAATSMEERIVAAYPFHPELIDLMSHRWGSLPGYQRTRGALQFLATVVHSAWARRGDRPPGPLIGPGDVDLAHGATRATFLEQVGETDQYTSVMEADFLAADAGTKAIDARIGRASAALERLRVGTRVGTAIMLLSFGARQGDERGAIEREVIEASLEPGLDANIVREALQDMRQEALLYLHSTNGRYRFETVPNVNKLVRSEAEAQSRPEIHASVRTELERALGAVARGRSVIWPADPAQVDDRSGAFRVVYLPPDWTDVPGALDDFVLHTRAGGNRTYRNAIGFAIPNATTFDNARRAMRTLLAIRALLGRAERLMLTGEQQEELRQREGTARRELDAGLRGAYERVRLPTGIDDSGVTYEELDLTTTLGTGRPIHDRVADALRGHVFDSMDPSRVVRIGRLDRQEHAWCEEIVDNAFRFFEYPRLWSEEPIRDAIARGVGAGAFAYVRGAREEAGSIVISSPESLWRLRQMRTEDVDLGPGCAIVTLTTAERLVPTAPPPGPAPRPGPGPGPAPGPGAGEEGGDPGPGLSPTRSQVRLDVNATEGNLYALNRALTGLRELVRPDGTMRISLTVEADAAGKEIDRVGYANKVREPLDEDADVAVRETWPQP
jgi:hypothetical protein